MLNIVVNENEVFLDGSLDFKIILDKTKNIPHPDEISTAIIDSLKALFKRKPIFTPAVNLNEKKIDAENQFVTDNKKVDDAPEVNLDISQIDADKDEQTHCQTQNCAVAD